MILYIIIGLSELVSRVLSINMLQRRAGKKRGQTAGTQARGFWQEPGLILETQKCLPSFLIDLQWLVDNISISTKFLS